MRVPSPLLRTPLMVTLLGAPASLPAVETVAVTVGTLEGEDLALERLRLRIDLTADPPRLEVTAARAASGAVAVEGLEVRCQGLELGGQSLACADGRLALASSPLGPIQAKATLGHQGRESRLSLTELPLWGAGVQATLRRDGARWRAEGRVSGLDLARWGSELGTWWPQAGAFQPQGRGRLTVDARGNGPRLERAQLDLSLEQAGFSSPDGRQAGEGLDARLALELEHPENAWGYDLEAEVSAGALYVEPWYLEAGSEAIEARGTGRYGGGGLALATLSFRQPDALEVEAQGTPLWSASGGVSGEARFRAPDLARTYKTWLQPMAAGTPLGRLEVSGAVNGELALTDSAPASVSVTLEDIYADDRDQRFGLYGAAGRIDWSALEARHSLLRWEGGHLWRMNVGPGTLKAESDGRAFRLTEPLSAPLLDGAAVIEELKLDLAAEDGPRGELGGYLEPVSMTELSRAFGWPVFEGQVSGVLPRIALADQRVTLDGALLMRIFDGQVVLRDLVLEQPFGVVPELRANLDIRNLDLAPLTGAFSFGLIEGRLEGRVHDLVLQSWQPVAFDARLQTPPEDDSRHRISQRAVDSLTQVGGGAGLSGALFLGLFEEFRYDTLALGCRLDNGVCTMSGVGPAEDGYYIVEGSGLPRIDVIGYNRKVDWNILVQRLQRVTQTGPALVE